MTSLRVAAEERRNAHWKVDGIPAFGLESPVYDYCGYCTQSWPCEDRVFAELVITTLNEAAWDTYGKTGQRHRLVPDPLGEHAN